jgi:Fic family protein
MFKPNKFLLSDDRLEMLPIVYFNFDIFEALKALDITTNWNGEINEVNIEENYLNQLNKKELERYIIEFSWKSSKIEGNTFTLLDTEELIKNNNTRKHSTYEVDTILNHKKAFDFIFLNKDYFKELSVKKIIEIHSILTSELGVKKGLRSKWVGITGSLYKPLDIPSQIEEALKKLVI